MDFKKFSQLIMAEQTLFALPFTWLGVLFAGGGTVADWIWVTLALAAARTAGMSFNRVIDARIDSKNPRTKARLLPQGKMRPRTVIGKRRSRWIVECFPAASSISVILAQSAICRISGCLASWLPEPRPLCC